MHDEKSDEMNEPWKEKKSPNPFFSFGIFILFMLIMWGIVECISWYVDGPNTLLKEAETKAEAKKEARFKQMFVKSKMAKAIIDFTTQYASDLEKDLNASGDYKEAGYSNFRVHVKAEPEKISCSGNGWHFAVAIITDYEYDLGHFVGHAVSRDELVEFNGKKLISVPNKSPDKRVNQGSKTPLSDDDVWVFHGEILGNAEKGSFSGVITTDESESPTKDAEQEKINKKFLEYLKTHPELF